MKPNAHDLTGKVAVVTGGAGVLCGAMSRALSVAGAKVAILNRTLEKAERLAGEIASSGGVAAAVQCDALFPERVRQAHEIVLEKFGPCDILVNGVGGNDPSATTWDETFDPAILSDPTRSSFFDLSPDAADAVFRANYHSVLIASQVFAADMIGRGGAIINISSMAADPPLTKVPLYGAAKASVNHLTKWLAVYFAKEGVRVNAIAPGFFSAEQNKRLLWNEDGTPTPRAQKILAGTPMGRFGAPDELIGTLLWLADERASRFVTGVVVPVDGGFSAYSGV
jgi:NAD(P)-dependent dehydrogenase (short-subunit alcohol dehydrogenase family)